MTTGHSSQPPPTAIRGHSSGPFSYVNSCQKTEELFPLGFLGREMCGGVGEGVRQNVDRQVFEKVATSDELNKVLPGKLKAIEARVREVYPDTAICKLKKKLGDEQLMQIAADTCLFLLVVFTMLLGPQGFSSQHILLAYGRVNKDKEKWLRSIFFVGNQIPFFMVDILMDSFESFRDRRNKLRSEGYVLPSDPLKLALFEFVKGDIKPPPFDVMHCLRSIILGPEPAFSIYTCDSRQGTASELSGLGYSFLPLPPKSGVRGIKCENSVLGRVRVYLPPMEINNGTCLELMANSLVDYEAAHGLQPEVESYLNLLCRLIRSPEDVQVLLSAGVISGVIDVESLLKVLKLFYEAPPADPTSFTRIDIQSCKPYFVWKYKKWLIGSVFVINTIFIFAAQLLQSEYTVLGYYKA